MFKKLGYTEQMIEEYEESEKIFGHIFEKVKDSTVINSPYDFSVISEGLNYKLKKKIKDIRLLYRASRDGDASSTFHSKCDGVANNITFVKATTGRRFGAFASTPWQKKEDYSSDEYAFLFSLDNLECYHTTKASNSLYDGVSYGPLFGNGHNFYLASGCRSNTTSYNQNGGSYDYKGKSYPLTGEKNFMALDYETYELIFE